MQEVFVAVHIGFAILSFLLAIGALCIGKKNHFHSKIGRIFVLTYIITLITSFIISFLFNIYNDAEIKFMLLTETILSVSVFIRGYMAVRFKKFSKERENINVAAAAITVFFSVILFGRGIFSGNNVLIAIGMFTAAIGIIDGRKSIRHNAFNYRWKYDHLYGMIFTAALLLFNGTSFFWIKDIYFETGNVPLIRMMLSIFPMILILIGIELIRKSVVNKNERSFSLHGQQNATPVQPATCADQ